MHIIRAKDGLWYRCHDRALVGAVGLSMPDLLIKFKSPHPKGLKGSSPKTKRSFHIAFTGTDPRPLFFTV